MFSRTGTRQQGAQLIEEIHAPHRAPRNAKRSQAGAKERGEMTVRRGPADVLEAVLRAKNPLHRHPKGATLRAARTVGDVVEREGVAPVIERG